MKIFFKFYLSILITFFVSEALLFSTQRNDLGSDKNNSINSNFLENGFFCLELKSQQAILAKCSLQNRGDLFLLNLLSLIKDFNFEEFLKGGHFLLEDQGKLYHLLKNTTNILPNTTRYSSHYWFTGKKLQQRGLKKRHLSIFPELLFGSIKLEDKTYSWFQLEKSTTTVSSLGHHIWDWCVYKFTKKQVSPYGFSIHTEKNSLKYTKRDCEKIINLK